MFENIFNAIRRLLGRLPESDTTGPDSAEHPVAPLESVQAANWGEAHGLGYLTWDNGWWRSARRTPAHEGRLGKTIVPRAAVVHTTDMQPGTFKTIVRSWTTRGGVQGAYHCAHFLIGRTPEDGVVQFAQITRNANHAGGPGPGYFLVKDSRGLAQKVHPNTVAVGIELDCAEVRRQEGSLRASQLGDGHPEGGRGAHHWRSVAPNHHVSGRCPCQAPVGLEVDAPPTTERNAHPGLRELRGQQGSLGGAGGPPGARLVGGTRSTRSGAQD
jgi:hypothetical protein